MDLNNHEQRTWLPAYIITIEIVTTIFLGIRLISRYQRTSGKLGIDDLLISISWAISTANAGCIILFAYKYGLSRHVWDVPRTLWSKGAQLSWIIAILFHWSTAFTKISVLLFYRRLVAGTFSKRFKWAIWSGITFVIAYTTVILIFLCSTCTPIEAEWRAIDSTYHTKYRCMSAETQWAAAASSGVFSVFSDVYSVLLPAVLLFKLKVTTRQRVGLIFIFGLSFLVVIAGIIRAIFFVRIQDKTHFDKTWLVFNTIAAGAAEAYIGIACACAPSLKSCFRSFFKDRLATLRSKASRSNLAEASKTNGTLTKVDRDGGKRWVVRSDGSPRDEKMANAFEQMERNVHGIHLQSGRDTRGQNSPQATFLSSVTTEDEYEEDLTALPRVAMNTRTQ